MNETAREFLERNSINIKEISAKTDIRVYTGRDIDKVVDEYRITKPSIKGRVSIANILGYNGYENMVTESIFENLDNYFDRYGNNYHKRSISLLDFETADIIDTLQESFHRDPIVAEERTPEKYIIGRNGLHRYHVLRIHYLKELSLTEQTPKEITQLNEKYTIPVEIVPVDYLKTFCNFLLNKLLGKIWIKTHLDDSWKPTGKVEFTFNRETFILDDFELITYVITKINQSKFKPYIMEIIQSQLKISKTFKAFYETYLKSALEGTKEVDPNGIYQSKQ